MRKFQQRAYGGAFRKTTQHPIFKQLAPDFVPKDKIREENNKNDAPPKGFRNNNPGNIKYDASAHKTNPWNGQANPFNDPEQEYVIFETPALGARASTKLVLNYQKKYGLGRVEDIITRYAPPKGAYKDGQEYENKTKAYIDHIYRELNRGREGESRIKRGQTLDLRDDPDLLRVFMATLFKHELGDLKYLSREDFEEGVKRGMNAVEPYDLSLREDGWHWTEYQTRSHVRPMPRPKELEGQYKKKRLGQ